MDNDQAQAEMPRYKCHKEVHALKIARVRPIGEGDDRQWEITPSEKSYAPFIVDFAYVRKHDPQIGGYYVVYDDGYKSFSPGKAFEEGYVRL
jgi:hypothetical protein